MGTLVPRSSFLVPRSSFLVPRSSFLVLIFFALFFGTAKLSAQGKFPYGVVTANHPDSSVFLMNNNLAQIKALGVNFIVHRINTTNLPIIRESGLKVIANNWHSEFDHSGKMIAELVNTVLEPGEFSHTFKPENHLSSGVYFIELVSGVYRAVQKTMYLK